MSLIPKTETFQTENFGVLISICFYFRVQPLNHLCQISFNIATACAPIKECPVVRDCRSFGSLDNGVKGLEFHIASISATIVPNSSYMLFELNEEFYLYKKVVK